MKKIKLEKGITLVALIITIIILLILAVVAIGAVNNTDIIGKAQEAKNKHEAGKTDEEAKLQGYEDYIKENSVNGDKENLLSYVTTITGLADGVTLVEYANLADELKTAADSGKIIAVLTEIKDAETYTAVIPKGFTVSTIEGENSISGGLVVTDGTNEFVWVPVKDDISITGYSITLNSEPYTEPAVLSGYNENVKEYDEVEKNLQRAGCEDLDQNGILEISDFKTELENMYRKMAESINKYDGFFVGRFETSKNGTNPQSRKSSSEEEIITAYNFNEENDWYGLFALNKKYKTSSVTGSMMWGIQYDKMMNWMGSNKAESTIGENINKERTCGTAPKDVINNIYDLYGNSCEWTLEASRGITRVHRGGAYCNSYNSPNTRDYHTTPTDVNDYDGSRLALCIEL